MKLITQFDTVKTNVLEVRDNFFLISNNAYQMIRPMISFQAR
jgi:hypothetical protein